MTLLDYCAHVAVVWLVASTIAAGAWSIAVTRYKRRAQATAEYVNWIPFLPPVPTQADIDATWLSLAVRRGRRRAHAPRVRVDRLGGVALARGR
jgi:hypothetical protein